MSKWPVSLRNVLRSLSVADAYDDGLAAIEGGDVIKAAFASAEFRRDFGALAALEFPELRRNLFIHIPKCAGSSMGLAAAQDKRQVVLRSPQAPVSDVPDWKAYYVRKSRDLFGYSKETLYLEYHLGVPEIEKFALARPWDNVFSVVREPIAQVVSSINYIAALVASQAGIERPLFGVPEMRAAMKVGANDDLAEGVTDSMVMGILGFVLKDAQCRYLGAPTAAGAMAKIALFNINVYDFPAVDKVFHRFGWPQLRENASPSLFRYEYASTPIRAAVEVACAQDRILYQALADQGHLIRQ